MASVDERRVYPRTERSVRVSLELSETGEVYAMTRDVSEGGVFVMLDREELPPVGELVNVRLPQDLDDDTDDDEWIAMRVARVEPRGIGLFFAD